MKAFKRAIIGLTSALLILAGCGGDEDSADVPATPSPIAADLQASPTAAAKIGSEATATDVTVPTLGPEAVVAISAARAFDPSMPDAIRTLNSVLYSDEGEITTANIVPPLSPLFVDDDPIVRWAALYLAAIATDTPEEIELLRIGLDDREPTITILVAGTLAGLGVTDALPVLIDGLDSPDNLAYSDPPEPLASHSRRALEYYTGESFPDSAAWREWWKSVESTIRWDGDSYAAD